MRENDFVADSAKSRFLQERLFDYPWQLQQDKVVSRVQVVFPTFVYDLQIAVYFSILVTQHPVDLVQFQGRRIVSVVYANGEPDVLFSFFHVSSPDTASASFPFYRCRALHISEARQAGSTIAQAYSRYAFEFAPSSSAVHSA